MINPVSSNPVPDYQGYTANADTLAKATVQAETVAVKPKTSNADTIELSTAAQAKLLKTQGLSVSAIASQLGLDLKTITSLLA